MRTTNTKAHWQEDCFEGGQDNSIETWINKGLMMVTLSIHCHEVGLSSTHVIYVLLISSSESRTVGDAFSFVGLHHVTTQRTLRICPSSDRRCRPGWLNGRDTKSDCDYKLLIGFFRMWMQLSLWEEKLIALNKQGIWAKQGLECTEVMRMWLVALTCLMF